MTNWYIKEFSKLAGVTVRTLHHYDQIGLLKASNRRANGYRLYSPEDLQKHQHMLLEDFNSSISNFWNVSFKGLKSIM